MKARGRLVAIGGGILDSIPLGLADMAVAGARALGDRGPGDLHQRFDAQMQRERAQDAYDEKRFPVSRGVGEVVGTGAQLVALAPLDVLVAVKPIAAATKLIARERAVIGGAGAAIGVGGQAVSDIASHRRSSVGDYAGAGLGGAANAVAAPFVGPSKAAAIGRSVTSLAQDAFNGRALNLAHAGQAAVTSGLIAGFAGKLSRSEVDTLSPRAKGEVGEFLSGLRTRARLDAPLKVPKSRESLPNGRYFYPDQRTASGKLVEAKFGPSARLSKGQTLAAKVFDGFRIDHFLPEHIGAMVGVPAGILGVPVRREEQRRKP